MNHSARVIAATLSRRTSAEAASRRVTMASLCHRHHSPLATTTSSGSLGQHPFQQQQSYFSTRQEESPGMIRGWMNDRKERKEKEQYMEQMERLSEMDSLTLANYQGELKRGLSGMAANIKVFQTKEIAVAQEVVSVIGHMIEVMGPDATADDLINIGRLEKLKVATASQKTVEEIGIMISQVQNMDVMQKCLRKRRLEGKPIPENASSMQEAIKKEAREVMSRTQKESIKKRQHTMARKMVRKRR